MKQLSLSLEDVKVALDALTAANDALALHTARGHESCGPCIEVGVQLIAAEERIRAAIFEGASHPSGPAPAPPQPETLHAWAGLKLRVH